MEGKEPVHDPELDASLPPWFVAFYVITVLIQLSLGYAPENNKIYKKAHYWESFDKACSLEQS